MSKTDFAKILGKDAKEARRILDPRHPTKLITLMGALAALGKRLIVAVEDAPARPRRRGGFEYRAAT
jgi:antitoxin HicB